MSASLSTDPKLAEALAECERLREDNRQLRQRLGLPLIKAEIPSPNDSDKSGFTGATVTSKSTPHVIGDKNGPARIVAEEMLVWGYRGSPGDGQFLSSEEAMQLLDRARPAGDLTPQSRENYFQNESKLIDQLREEFDAVAEERNKHLVEAHERFSKFFRAGRYEVVYPVLPMDILGLYILLPEASR